jgi:hypothetical protein
MHASTQFYWDFRGLKSGFGRLNRFGEAIRICEERGLFHASCDQPGSGRKRSPYLAASLSSACSTLGTPRVRA